VSGVFLGRKKAPGTIGENEGKTQRDPRKRIPIIAMTANVFREDVELCLKAGMNDHIGKALNMDAVFALLKKYLN